LKKQQNIRTLFSWEQGTARVTVQRGNGEERYAEQYEVPIELAEIVWEKLLKNLLKDL
jgi:hypothetical protein